MEEFHKDLKPWLSGIGFFVIKDFVIFDEEQCVICKESTPQ
jgi:uncharacterized membrane protein YkgB